MTPTPTPTEAAPERAAFVYSICADPADDTARLAFADWLDDRGEGDLAEFIRLQVRIPLLQAGVNNCPVGRASKDGSEIRGMAKEMTTLLARQDELGSAWDAQKVCCPLCRGGPFRPPPSSESDQAVCAVCGGQFWSCLRVLPDYPTDHPACVVTRGFVSSVTVPADRFGGYAEAGLFARYPITEVRLGDFWPTDDHRTDAEGLFLVPTDASYDVDVHRLPDDVRGPVAAILGRRYPYQARGIKTARGWVEFDTRAEASAALSDALVAHGRAVAGLPDLPHDPRPLQ